MTARKAAHSLQRAKGALASGFATVDLHHARGHDLALAWVLKRSPVMVPIPGTSKVKHLEENVRAADVVLTDDQFSALDAEGRKAFRAA
jgi:aryl-alcohol dehydrogenase-like predicted oxidoreductase